MKTNQDDNGSLQVAARLGPGHSTITWDTAQTGVAVADTTGGAGRDRPTGR